VFAGFSRRLVVCFSCCFKYNVVPRSIGRVIALNRRKVVIFLPLLLLIGALGTSVVHGGYEYVGALDDSYVDANHVEGNFGGDDYMYLDGSRKGLVQFGTKYLYGLAVTSATLKLYIHGTAIDSTVDVIRITGSWTEGSVTFASEPSDVGTPTANAYVEEGYADWMIWDVWDDVDAFVSGSEENHGWKIVTDGAVAVRAKEYGYATAPVLEIGFLNPSIESCNIDGDTTDTFELTDDVYVKGNWFRSNWKYNISVVEDVTWFNGMEIPSAVPYTINEIVTDEYGEVWPTEAWLTPLTPGKYDIIVDVGGDGYFNAGIDTIDDVDISTAGFLVVPEYMFGGLLAVAACFAAFAISRRPRLNLRSK